MSLGHLPSHLPPCPLDTCSLEALVPAPQRRGQRPWCELLWLSLRAWPAPARTDTSSRQQDRGQPEPWPPCPGRKPEFNEGICSSGKPRPSRAIGAEEQARGVTLPAPRGRRRSLWLLPRAKWGPAPGGHRSRWRRRKTLRGARVQPGKPQQPRSGPYSCAVTKSKWGRD